MSFGENRRINEMNLRLGAATAEIEGLYAALLRVGTGTGSANVERRQMLLADLTRAGRRLVALSSLPHGASVPRPQPNSRWQRRRVLAARGATWLSRRLAQR
jgi:hypothetical protein